MVTKDGDSKAATPKRPAATSTKPAASGSAAPRAAASPSRLRAGAGKPAPSVTPKPPAVKAPSITASKPAGSTALKSPSAAASSSKGGTSTTSATAAKGTAAKTGSSLSKGSAAKGARAKGAAPGKGVAAKGAAGKGPAGEKAEAQPLVEPGPNPEEEAARRAELEAKLAEEMEALRRAAWQAQVEYERKQEAKRRQEREEEAKRKKEEAALRKTLLEAAYDGEDDAVQAGLKRAREAGLLKPDPVEAADGHGNTLLSEAAAGGAVSTVALLLQLGAEPNSRGEFLRTPLWRAAFLGKEEVVPVLLQGGADPRIGNEGGELPEHVAPAAIKEMLKAWDVAKTDSLLQQIETRRLERVAAVQAERAAAVKGCEDSLAAAEEDNLRAQQTLKHARMELEKRIHEYDTCVEEKKPESLTQVALDQVHQAEKVVEDARRRAVETAEALDAARLRLRQEQQQQLAEGGEETEALPGVPVAVRALNDVLIRDVGGLVAASGKWPLVIDTSGQASVFLRYQDTNYVNALNSRHLEPQMLRRSLLGAIRYGKPLVLDLQDCDLWPEMPRIFDQVQAGLLASLLDKSLLKGERYVSLIRVEDGEEYDRNKFQDVRVKSFGFIVLTGARKPNPTMVGQMYTVRVMINE